MVEHVRSGDEPPAPRLHILTEPAAIEDNVENYRLTWTQDGRGEQQVSAVTYGLSAAEEYKAP
ncbi:hypothetical protein [Streptomyces sp. NPDC058548]|uniref:hypothetical protein n=1 Tax=Streptomyces sp. NPDC058548 TaxID=3346545 RepID=UPI0036540311